MLAHNCNPSTCEAGGGGLKPPEGQPGYIVCSTPVLARVRPCLKVTEQVFRDSEDLGFILSTHIVAQPFVNPVTSRGSAASL